MEITLQEVGKKFNQLIEGEISRKSVSDWAYQIRSSDDVEPLSYDPVGAGDKIWKALIYLEGVDLHDKPNEYLHSVKDFKDKRDFLEI